MRIIAGKYRGHQLVPFSEDHIRPTTDRVKESLFNSIQFHVEGALVLDLFSGTGNLAFEALSRGAKKVLAVEASQRSIHLIKKNQKKLGVGEELEIKKSDVFKFLENYRGEPFDFIFIDPPFTRKWGDRVMKQVAGSGVFSRVSQIMIETSKSEAFANNYSPLVLKKQKKFSDKFLSFFQVS